MNAATRQFIESHLKDDVRQLALSMFPEDVDKTLALNQIEARQVLSKKVPSWASNPDLLFPKHLSLEQCSSELTAKYKASLVENGDVFVDLTGGLGIDSYFLSEKFKTSYYVENQKGLCELAEHNFAVLDRKITVVNDDSELFLSNNQNFDLIFIDPARRDIYNRKMISLHDCSPDVLDLLDNLLLQSKCILIKLSPMLDISVIINELPNIAEIHIVAVKNECKEVLVLLRPDYDGEPLVISTEAQRSGEISFKFRQSEEQSAIPIFATTIKKYLYEPNAALMKAGAFKLVSQRFGIDKLHINSHLYTSDNLISDFPGRIFEVVDYAPFSKKIKKELLKDVAEASVAVRNFPLSANELRKSLNLKESDENFVFGTTMMGENKVVIYCKKHRE
jgi:hypothetical protein